ncbi:MAG: PilN domain-containing protein [Fibrobacter sp.]|uniref:PilN domain-containing protein n=1 Tax=Fibrobacter sp. TaxID=35828 RepID=UPI001B212F2B|nr:PilN domain-containing protein [Fibrobacter sp.]MBO7061278.1 PilN domain-containing protein [Fibrobacter sp.]
MTPAMLFGRFWWCLEYRESSATISLVLKKKGKATIAKQFQGSLEECKSFQNLNGGIAEGVLLVDDITPVKTVYDRDSFDLPGYRKEDFDFVESPSEDFIIASARRSVEKAADTVKTAGFNILLHTPALYCKLAQSKPVPDSDGTIFIQEQQNVLDLWAFAGSELKAYYRMAKENSVRESLVNFIKGEYGIANPEIVDFEEKETARIIADDVWTFRTTAMPSFSTVPDAGAFRRLREASLFRKVLKAACVVTAFSVIGTFAFEIVNYFGESSTEKERIAYEKQLDSEKEFSKVVQDLEKQVEKTRGFLTHRSKIATQILALSKALPADSWITSWRIDGLRHSVQGLALNSDNISKFLQTLENSGKFKNVRLRTTEKTTYKKKPAVKFDILAEVP